jgi:hypothetical protein
MVEITYQMFLSTLQTVGLLVGIIYYIIIMRNSQRTRELTLKAQEHATETRQLDLFMRWHQELTKPEVRKNFSDILQMEWEDFDDFRRKYDSTVNPDNSNKRLAVWSFFEGIGYLLSRGVIDADTVHEMLGPGSLGVWIKFEPIIQAYRKHYGRHELWEWFEYLMVELKKVRERRGLIEYVIPDIPE